MGFFAAQNRWELANGEVASCTLRFETGTDWTNNLLSAAATATIEAWNDAAALFCPDVGRLFPRVFRYERVAGSEPGTFKFEPTSGVFQGGVALVANTHAGESLPPQNALVVTLATGAPGRRARGRVYLPPLPETKVDSSGTVTGPNDYAAVVLAWADAVAAVDVVDPAVNIVHSITYGDTNEVTGYGSNDRIDTQRRRLN